MGSQRKQVFSRVSFLGGFLTQNSEAFLGHFLVRPLQEANADPCSAWPALRPALNCSAETTHKRASADTDTCAPTYELPALPQGWAKPSPRPWQADSWYSRVDPCGQPRGSGAGTMWCPGNTATRDIACIPPRGAGRGTILVPCADLRNHRNTCAYHSAGHAGT